ncbi:MAG TPA: hypothetical protein VLV50_03420 [Stellaceae bacterium]|nr:hypothetical protein [Stellaceae bacterium]
MGRVGATALALALAAAAPAAADDFYAGKQITLYIGSTPGGGYDSYARLLARHWSEHIPGHPTIVPVNMPGAGSNKLAYYIFAVAPKDGTAVGEIFPGAVLEPLIGNQQVPFDPKKLLYVGSANRENFLCVLRSDTAVKSFKDAFTNSVRLAASAQGGSTREMPLMLNRILGTKFEIVAGYPGSREMMLAIEQGEVAGLCGISDSSIAEAHPDWLPSGKYFILAHESTIPDPALAAEHVPITGDFAKSADDKAVLELMYSQQFYGRPFVVPPETPPDRVEVLRQAFSAALADPATVEDAKRVRLALRPSNGAAVQAVVDKVYKTPPAIVARLKAAIAPTP